MVDEQNRLDEVQRYDVLDSEREPAFDRLAELTAHLCATPIAFIAIIDEHRIWHKAEHGLRIGEYARAGSLCTLTLGKRLNVVENALLDPYAKNHPVVTGPLALRFYAGVPLTTPRGLAIGTLCVLDKVARTLSVEQERALFLMRDEIMRLLEDRRELIELRRAESLRQEAVEALLATKIDLEMRIAMRTREVEHARDKIKSILQRVADGFVALDADWNFTYVNEKTGRTFHRIPEELVGKNIWEEYPNIVGQAFNLACMQAMREQQPITLHDYVPAVDRWFEDRLYPSPAGLTIFFTETTGTRRVERALEDTARRLAEAQTVAHVGSWEWSVAANKVVWSEEMHRIYGTTPETFDGTYESFLARVHVDDREYTRNVVGDAYMHPKRFVYDHKIVRSDGAVRMLHTVGQSIGDASGRVARMVGTCWDTTEQWEASKKLAATGALVDTVLESVHDGVAIIDEEHRVVAVNAACAQMFALPAALCGPGQPAGPLEAHIAAQLGEGVVFPPPGGEVDGALRMADGRRLGLRSRPFHRDGRAAGRVWSFLR
jgi:PAS domain S-box-containing protein